MTRAIFESTRNLFDAVWELFLQRFTNTVSLSTIRSYAFMTGYWEQTNEGTQQRKGGY